jgi:hypothetical protein
MRAAPRRGAMSDETRSRASGAESFAETLRRARAGDREAALDAIDLCISALQSRRISRAMCDYLATALSIAIQGPANAKQHGAAFLEAFHLQKPANRPQDESRAARDADIANWVHLAVKLRDLSLPEAKLAAEEPFGVENIARSLRAAGFEGSAWVLKPFRGNAALCEELFAKQGRPLPSRR